MHCATIHAALATLLAITAPSRPAAAIDYVESSSGLEEPGMEAGSTEIEFGDVDADGHTDILCVGDHGSPFINSDQHGIMVWFGDGEGGWSLHQYGNFGYGGLALGDVNNDGHLDVGYGIHHNYSGEDLGDQLIEVVLGDGTGLAFAPWDDGLATAGESWGMFGTDFADIDNDGDLDLASVSFGCCNGVKVYLNNGDGTWTHAWGDGSGNSHNEIVFGEVNGDGHADFAAAHDGGTVYFGNGDGTFTTADVGLPGGPYRAGIALGDVNDDGRDDLAFRTSNGVAVHAFVGDQWQDLTGSLASIGDVKLTHIADMNVDGHGDVVAFFLGEVRIYTGDGAGNWTLAATVPTAEACDYAAFRAGADVDHNGFPDFAFVAEEDCNFWVGGINTPHAFTESSTPDQPTITLSAPRGGETLIAGSVRFIDWIAAVPSDEPQPPTVTIELSTTGPDGPFETIAESVPNNGRFQWLVPASIPTSDDCHLRLTLETETPVSATNANPFTIVNLSAPLGDLNGDGLIDVSDLLILLAAWGECDDPEDCSADLDDSGVVDVSDLLTLLAAWG